MYVSLFLLITYTGTLLLSKLNFFFSFTQCPWKQCELTFEANHMCMSTIFRLLNPNPFRQGARKCLTRQRPCHAPIDNDGSILSTLTQTPITHSFQRWTNRYERNKVTLSMFSKHTVATWIVWCCHWLSLIDCPFIHSIYYLSGSWQWVWGSLSIIFNWIFFTWWCNTCV